MKIILILLLLSESLRGIVNFKKFKGLNKKISKKPMPIAWHPRRWWNFCMSEADKI